MSNSNLADYIKLSPHCTKPRRGTIRGISIHTMAGPGSVEGCGEVFQTTKASAHYGVGPDGRIGQYVREEDRAWCCSHPVDHEVVTIEVSSIQKYQEPYQCTEEAYRSLIDLCVDICQRNGIRRLIWKEGKANCPAYTKDWETCNLVPHRYTTDKGKSCPGNYLFGKYAEITEQVNRRLNDENEATDVEKLIETITDDQAYRLMTKAMRYAAALEEPAWSREEGHWAKATAAGLVDGTAPERPLKRDEAVALLGRLGRMDTEKDLNSS
ncbi:MAG: N-acetylmuramoyl-L-alanine amidase [Clostridiales bacterium]|nr:N-acetylmuramoyl-L-alanine amidase [Clostridiales bacterium]